MDNSNTVKLFSAQDAIKIFAKTIGSQPQDLIAAIKDKDLSDLDSLNDFITPYLVSKRNADKTARDDKYNAGFRKGRKRAEEEFAEVFQVDTEGQELSSLYMDIKQKMNSKGDSKDKQITASQAFQVKEVKDSITALKKQVLELENVQTAFDSYKNLQGIKSKGLSFLSNHNAIWSEDTKRRIRQEKAFESALQSNKYKIDSNGSIVVLDSDGTTPLHNQKTGENWIFEDWVLEKSPVDFGKQGQPKKDKKPFNSNNDANNSGNSFGFSKSKMTKFSLDDYENAKKEGLTQKAQFIMDTVVAAEAEKQNSNK